MNKPYCVILFPFDDKAVVLDRRYRFITDDKAVWGKFTLGQITESSKRFFAGAPPEWARNMEGGWALSCHSLAEAEGLVMGEMADLTLEDYWDWDHPGHWEDPEFYPAGVFCQYCGYGPLTGIWRNEQWKLYHIGSRSYHTCTEYGKSKAKRMFKEMLEDDTDTET